MISNPSQEIPSESASAQPDRPAPEHPALRALSLVAVVFFAAGVVASLLHARSDLAAVLRWVGLGLFVPYAVRRRSLLVWTFFAMVAGAELGADAPHSAVQSRFLAGIFLR